MIMEWAIAVVAALFSLVAAICHLEASRAARRAAFRAASRGQRHRPVTARAAEHQGQTGTGEDSVALTDLATLRAVISGQRKEIGYLRDRVQDAEWRLRSAGERIKFLTEAPGPAVQSRPAASGEAGPAASEQFRRLRALILKEIHPDHATSDDIDRDVRTVLFKRIWPKIEALSEHV